MKRDNKVRAIVRSAFFEQFAMFANNLQKIEFYDCCTLALFLHLITTASQKTEIARSGCLIEGKREKKKRQFLAV